MTNIQACYLRVNQYTAKYSCGPPQTLAALDNPRTSPQSHPLTPILTRTEPQGKHRVPMYSPSAVDIDIYGVDLPLHIGHALTMNNISR